MVTVIVEGTATTVEGEAVAVGVRARGWWIRLICLPPSPIVTFLLVVIVVAVVVVGVEGN
jgi:hypothetical protein